MQDVSVKQLGVEDAAVLSAVAIEAYRAHYADTWYDGGEWYMNTFLSPTHLVEELQDADALFFFVYSGSTPVGFFKLNQNKPLPGSTQPALELERIYLLKSASGKGMGTWVLHWIVAWAKQKKYKRIWLKAMDTNEDAVRFYQKLGFEICGTHAVSFPQKKEGLRGMYIMQKQL